MDFVTFLILFFTVLFFHVFTFNLKAAKLTMDCYYPERETLKYIRGFRLNSTKVIQMRCEIADALGIKLSKKDKKPGLFTKIVINVYTPLFDRIGIEQSAVNNWFISPVLVDKNMPLRIYILKAYREFVSDQAEVELSGKLYTELDKLYIMYRITHGLAKGLGITDFETIINKPIIDSMFKGVDKMLLNDKSLEERIKYIITTCVQTRKVAKTRYEVSLMLKIIPFLHPNFKNSPQYKLFTNN